MRCMIMGRFSAKEGISVRGRLVKMKRKNVVEGGGELLAPFGAVVMKNLRS